MSKVNKLSFMSWNIQSRDGLNGNKLHDPEFIKLLISSDIFCLQECRKPIKIEKYICLNKRRPNNSGGGVAICYSRRISPGIKEYKTEPKSEHLAVVLDKTFFSLKKDTLLISCYIPPQSSKYLRRNGIQPFDELNSLLCKTADKFDIIICGDFNSRTQTLDDSILCNGIPGIEMTHDSNDSDNPTLARNNKDTNKNGYTTSFMDLLSQADLRIVNGRCLGDIYGELTCVNYNGASTVDYFAVNSHLLKNVVSFNVHPLTEFSDHRPLSLLLKTHNSFIPSEQVSFDFDPVPQSYKWDASSPTSFYKAQQQDNINQLLTDLSEYKISNPYDVHDYNNKLTNILHSVCAASLTRTNNKNMKQQNKHKWFDSECRLAKRMMNSALRKYNKSIANIALKRDYLNARKQYRKLLKTKKKMYFANLNEQIESAKKGTIDWAAYKKLKDTNHEDTIFDDFDINTFYEFFQHLYTNISPIDHDQKITLKSQTDKLTNRQPITDDLTTLNRDITGEEVKYTIKTLANGKSVSLDLVSNEMLKHLTNNSLQALVRLFNYCLEYGIYPWTTSTITPILKTGDPYRAIALGSCMGKLFSSILLRRIQEYRAQCCPDHPNQLGFKKGAQTADHIVTLKTIIDKYTIKHKRKLFACFVDFKKAFDSVAREALLYKVALMGIGGNVFKILKNMYENTSARIKLIRKLSQHIKLENGVEQGHPLSPELFKIFIHDLSTELNEIFANTPELNNINISHLFWADDLVLLALSEGILQKLVDILSKFCEVWGLKVNLKKTKLMIFNKPGRVLSPMNSIMLNGSPIEICRTYCYLGIVFVPSGKFKVASNELRKKALRAFFKLKSGVMRENMSAIALFKLFDALIQPILAYGCQTLFPESSFASQITKPSNRSNWQQNWLSSISKDPFEKVHLKYIKWVLGVHKKASNIGCWGESCRVPLGITLAKQFYKYVMNASSYTNDKPSFLYNSYMEQKSLNLPWYQTFCKIDKAFSPVVSINLQDTRNPIPSLQFGLTNMFRATWKGALQKSPKLNFLVNLKTEWGKEHYIRSLSFSLRKNLTRLRISAHMLPIETGRYNKPPTLREKRTCPYCYNKNLSHPNILGDELHLIFDCLANSSAKNKTNTTVQSLLISKDVKSLFSLEQNHLVSFALYLNKSYTEYLNFIADTDAS